METSIFIFLHFRCLDIGQPYGVKYARFLWPNSVTSGSGNLTKLACMHRCTNAMKNKFPQGCIFPQGGVYISSGRVYISSGRGVHFLREGCTFPQRRVYISSWRSIHFLREGCTFPQGGVYISPGWGVHFLREGCILPQERIYISSGRA